MGVSAIDGSFRTDVCHRHVRGLGQLESVGGHGGGAAGRTVGGADGRR